MSREFIRYRMPLDSIAEEPAIPPDGVRWEPFDHDKHAADARELLNAAYKDGGGAVEDFDAWWPQLRDDAEFDDALCFVATDVEGGRVIGFAQCWTSAFIKDIAVAPNWRRRALGKALMQRIFQSFKERGSDHVDLKVEVDNPHGAVQFYKSLGMIDVDEN